MTVPTYYPFRTLKIHFLPFDSGLLWGQQPADQGSGATRAQPTALSSVSDQQFAGVGAEAQEDAARAAEEPQLLRGAGICTWFNVRVGFGFLPMTARAGVALDPPTPRVDVFVHQSKLHMEGFRSLKEGEAVEFTFKKSAKGLESIRVPGPGGVSCIGSERRPKGKNMQKRRSKGDGCYNCGGLDHHAKECKLPPQPKGCHFCQSINHMVASRPLKAQQAPSSQGKPAYFPEEEEEIHGPAMRPEAQN
ncbi:protein lin-28 homolog A-like [Balaenoptera ricei]|uniref:protein lin-28 homolog A-like n=1 Tax=Balaenoptera ricei TaxID=2746895 RepID=UPI0028BDF289|nr:protein lin-28 homolog A-like [Balaenoptera ricei]